MFNVEKIIEKFKEYAKMDMPTKKNVMAIDVKHEKLHEIAKYLYEEAHFFSLSSITGIDTGSSYRIVYHLWNPEEKVLIEVITDVSSSDPVVDSLIDVWPSADWLERETYDLLGVKFTGHPQLERLLLPSNFSGHPLRKDYVLKEPEKMEVLKHYE